MKRATIFRKANDLFYSIIPTQKKVREYSETYIKKVLEAHGGSIDLTEVDNMVSVTYDGGNHPEYASNAFSTVEGVFLDKDGDIALQVEDCSEYPLENINWDEVYDVAAFIHENIDNSL